MAEQEFGIIGDMSAVDLPQAPKLEANELAVEKQMARFSKSKEFKALKEHLESRIEYYRHRLPGGTEFNKLVEQQDMAEVGKNAVISSTIIQEFQMVIDSYERAAEAVKDAQKQS